MPGQPFRFLHTSDFRLEAVPQGLADVPDHLRDALLDAPYTAARRVFDIAVSERVAFVLLAGNILRHERGGARGLAFMTEQFERLAAAKIAVYWAASESDRPDAWPAGMTMPPNVHLLPRDHLGEFLHTADGTPLARIVGVSRGERELHAAEFVPDPVGLFSVAVACGEMDAEEMKSQGIHYWALGGRAERKTLFDSPSIAHYPGTPQGRGRSEQGSRGCTLVALDDAGHARLTPVAASALEWHEEPLHAGPATTRDELESVCSQRIHALAAQSKCDVLVAWTISGNGPVLHELHRGKLRSELLEWLRNEHGLSTPAVWTVGLEAAPAAALSGALYEQETLLGDYLRMLRDYASDPDRPLTLETLLPGEAGGLRASVALADPAARTRILHEAALLGVDLLSGDGGENEENE